MPLDIKNLTIQKAHQALLAKEFSAMELAQAYLDMIAERNAALNVYLEVFDDVLEQAAAADKRIAEGSATMLTGIPIALKDNILIKGRKASSASKMLENYVATYDATVTKKLKEQGVVFLGRVNMDEFAMGASTENSAFGVTKNPHDETRVSGGTSGGSAAAVAAGMALAALGSDTGGSIRQPSGFCGVVGMKPTYGRVSRFGLMAMTSSLDQIGPVANTVEDAQILFKAISGLDPSDSTTLPESAGPAEAPKDKYKLGVPKGLLEMEGLDPATRDNFKASLEKLRNAGYEIVDIETPDPKLVLAAYYIIVPAEVSSNLSRFDGVKYGLHKDGANSIDDYFETRGAGFGTEVRRRILLGTYVLSSGYYDAYYNKAVALRRQVERQFVEAFKQVDAIVTPTSPNPAFKIGEKANDPLAMYLADIFTISANIGGNCAISVPAGFVEREGKSLPLDLHIMAGAGREDILFFIGKKFESIP